MRCPNCGSESPDNVKFCQRCGAPLGGQQMAGPPYAQAGAPPKKKSMLVPIIVIVVVAIVVLAIVGVILALNTFNHATHQDIDMTVTNVGTPTASIPASTGDKYVQLTLSIKNNGEIPLTISHIFFTLHTSTGTYTPTNNVPSDTPGEGILAGNTAVYLVSFEVPNTATLNKIVYSGIFGSAEADVP